MTRDEDDLRAPDCDAAKDPGAPSGPERTRCSLLSHHGQVLVCIAADQDASIRAIAKRVELTERAVSRILVDLQAAGLVSKRRVGRRNHYTLHAAVRVRLPTGLQTSATVAMVLSLLADDRSVANSAPSATAGHTCETATGTQASPSLAAPSMIFTT